MFPGSKFNQQTNYVFKTVEFTKVLSKGFSRTTSGMEFSADGCLLSVAWALVSMKSPLGKLVLDSFFSGVKAELEAPRIEFCL